MVRKKLWALLAMMVVLAGCGGGASSPSKVARHPSGESAPQAPAQVERGGGGWLGGAASDDASGAAPSKSVESAASAPRTLAGADAPVSPRSEPAPPPHERPGLGTEWGETRTSRVRDVSFVRDSSAPFATATLHYNDRRGVEALADLHALRDTRREVPAGGGAVAISLRDADGEPLEALRVRDRTFVIGQAGQRYTIVLENRTSRRFEAVATVDGLDVVNGTPGSFDNRGYVLMPFATLEIEGFRQSSRSVASFRFASVADSYAAETGSARNVGVIGVALFAERGDAFVPESELRLRDTARPFPTEPRFAPPPPPPPPRR